MYPLKYHTVLNEQGILNLTETEKLYQRRTLKESKLEIVENHFEFYDQCKLDYNILGKVTSTNVSDSLFWYFHVNC